ncbi:MAG TPA: hypothetical protein VK507_04145 [Iamia sp.]|nr:hypothetical protein [Iamia sp.]
MFKPAGDEPTESQDDETVARGLGYLESGRAKNPANDDRTRGWLGKINDAVDRHKAREEGKKGK